MKTLRLILGDQLNLKHFWFKETNEDVVYCLFEMRQETDYVKHHIQKVIGFFAAMRQFAEELKTQGHDVEYFKINDEINTQNLTKNISKLIKEHEIETIEYILPDEYRLDNQLNEYCKSLSIGNKAKF